MAASSPPSFAARLLRRWPEALLVLAIFLCNLPALHGPYIFDDAPAVVDNPTIRHLWPPFAALTPPPAGGTTTGRPLTNYSFALTRALGGDTPEGHRLANLAIHAFAALLLAGSLRRLLLRPVFAGPLQASARPLGLLVAALWSLHPLVTESVLCIAQRTESLAGLCILATLYAFIRGAEGPRSALWFAASIVICLAGQAVKEIVVVAPVLVLLLDRAFIAGNFAAAWRARRACYLGLAATWMLTLLLVFSAGGTRGLSAGLGLGVSPWHYLLTQCRAIVLYLGLAFWPHPLVVDYGTAVVHSPATVWWQGPLVLILLGATIWALFRAPRAGFLGAWFFIILAPSSSLIPLVSQTIAEHRMYLPLIAIVVPAVLLLWRFAGAARPVFFIPWIGLYATLTLLRAGDYRTSIGLWTQTVAACPSNPRAHNNLGRSLLDAGRAAPADAEFSAAVALDPLYVLGHYNRGLAAVALARPALALPHFAAACRLAPEFPDAWLGRGNALAALTPPRYAEAIDCYRRALALQPAADTHCNLAFVLHAVGRDDEAIAELEQALALDSSLESARTRLASLLSDRALAAAQSGRLDAAAADFSRAAGLTPTDPAPLANLGNVRLLQSRWDDAEAAYVAALRIDPTDTALRENLSEVARLRAAAR